MQTCLYKRILVCIYTHVCVHIYIPQLNQFLYTIDTDSYICVHVNAYIYINTVYIQRDIEM